MKKKHLFTAILAGTLAVCTNLSANEIAAATYPATDSGNLRTDTDRTLTSRIITSFRESLKANHAAGAVVVNSLTGTTITSVADMDKDFQANSLAAASLDKRMIAATNKAFTASYFGTDTAKIADRDVMQHNDSLSGASLTNLPGGVIVKDLKGRPAYVIGVSAVGINGQDLSAKIATDMSAQLASRTDTDLDKK